jgi:hypothetical protein
MIMYVNEIDIEALYICFLTPVYLTVHISICERILVWECWLLRHLHSTTMERDDWVLLLIVLFLDYVIMLPICIVWFAISRCFGYRLVKLVSELFVVSHYRVGYGIWAMTQYIWLILVFPCHIYVTYIVPCPWALSDHARPVACENLLLGMVEGQKAGPVGDLTN